MNKNIKIILLILFSVSLLRIFIIFINEKNVYKEEQKEVIGIVTNIKTEDDKIIVDLKSKIKYRITLYNDKINFSLGDKILVKGTFKSPSDNTVFNLFNYRKYLLSKNIKMISINPSIVLVSKTKNPLYIVKNNIIKHTDKYKTKSYIKAFIIGDSSVIEENVLKSYRNMGISHLLAISGMHIGIFLSIINTIFRKFKCKNLIIFLFLSFFLFITNFTESLLRCLLFLLLTFINKNLSLKVKSTYIIILTACILLIINPYLIYSIGFVFSVIITFFVILINKKLKNKNYLIKTFIMSLMCFLASIPILAYNFFNVNFLAPLFNLIFIPIISMIIFPLGLLTFLFPILDNIYLIFINILEYLAINLDKIKILSFVISKPNVIVIFIYYLILYFSIKHNKKYILLFIIMLLINLNTRFFIKNPEVIFLDVGQGDSTVIILPGGKTILIDTGGTFTSNYSLVENKTVPYLNSRGIARIDLLILTHGDYDHMGEAKELISLIKVDNILINKGKINNLENEILNNKKVSKAKDNYIIGEYEFLFLNNKIYDNENSNSIVTYINIKNNNILLMGDADKKVEKNIIDEYNLPKMDILKVGHHGSKTSSDEKFINEINPLYSIISVGKNNRYGHPNKEVIQSLKRSNILRTDIHGSIRFVFRQNMVNKFDCKPYIIVER